MSQQENTNPKSTIPAAPKCGTDWGLARCINEICSNNHREQHHEVKDPSLWIVKGTKQLRAGFMSQAPKISSFYSVWKSTKKSHFLLKTSEASTTRILDFLLATWTLFFVSVPVAFWRGWAGDHHGKFQPLLQPSKPFLSTRNKKESSGKKSPFLEKSAGVGKR